MTRCQSREFPVTAGHDATEDETDCLLAAAILLQQTAAEVEPLAQLSAAMATAIEAVQRDVEALIPIVDFIPVVSEGSPCLSELQQLAKARIARIADQIGQITHQAEQFVQEFPSGRRLACARG